MLNDPLANVLSKVMNAQKIGRRECTASPTSTIIKRVLDIMHTNKYIGKIEIIDPKGIAQVKINLIGSLNKCAVIKPRFSVKKDDYEKFEKRYLPAKDIGIIIVSTPQGIMTHHEAKEKKIGGSLLAYVY